MSRWRRSACPAVPSPLARLDTDYARCAAWSSTPSVDADPNADDDDQVPDGGPLPPDVVDSAAELKQARARALWHLKSQIASAVVRGNKPILDRYLQLCRDRDSTSAEPTSGAVPSSDGPNGVGVG